LLEEPDSKFGLLLRLQPPFLPWQVLIQSLTLCALVFPDAHQGTLLKSVLLCRLPCVPQRAASPGPSWQYFKFEDGAAGVNGPSLESSWHWEPSSPLSGLPTSLWIGECIAVIFPQLHSRLWGASSF
jgi:hypothetical protein